MIVYFRVLRVRVAPLPIIEHWHLANGGLGDKLQLDAQKASNSVRSRTMYRQSLFFRSLVSLVAVGYLVIHPGVSPAVAAQLTSEQVSQFIADPSALLTANPNGGGRLVSQIRDLMLSDSCLPSPSSPRLPSCELGLTAIIALLANANDAQKSAIGAGLGDAAQAMVTTNPSLANEIQTKLAAAGDKLAVEAYQTTVGNQAIGAAGGGGGAGNAAYQTLTNTGGGGGGGLATGATASGTSVGLTGGGTVSSGSTTTTTTAAAVSAQ
jgi:hypothetical protein